MNFLAHSRDLFRDSKWRARHACLGVLLALHFAASCAATEADRTRALAALHRRFPGRFIDPRSIVFADLDSDGREDFAAFLGDPMSNQPDRVLRAVAFHAISMGRFELLGSTLDLPSGGQVTQMLSANAHALSIERSGSEGCCAVWKESLKFGWRDHRLKLVGVAESVMGTGNRLDERGRSVNAITGDVLQWRKSDRRRHEARNRSVPQRIDFDGFDYDSAMARFGPWS